MVYFNNKHEKKVSLMSNQAIKVVTYFDHLPINMKEEELLDNFLYNEAVKENVAHRAGANLFYNEQYY